MKTFREKISVTKLVLLIIVVSLVIIELYKTYIGLDMDQVFIDVILMVVAFYYGQKGMKYDKVDSIVEDVDDLDSKENK